MARSELFNSKSSNLRFCHWPLFFQSFTVKFFLSIFRKIPDGFNYELSVPASNTPCAYSETIKEILRSITCFLDDVIIFRIRNKNKSVFDLVIIGVLDEDSGEYVIDELCVVVGENMVRLKYDTVDSSTCSTAFHYLFQSRNQAYQFKRLAVKTTVIPGMELRNRHLPKQGNQNDSSLHP
jgi:hypothetical protein